MHDTLLAILNLNKDIPGDILEKICWINHHLCKLNSIPAECVDLRRLIIEIAFLGIDKNVNKSLQDSFSTLTHFADQFEDEIESLAPEKTIKSATFLLH